MRRLLLGCFLLVLLAGARTTLTERGIESPDSKLGGHPAESAHQPSKVFEIEVDFNGDTPRVISTKEVSPHADQAAQDETSDQRSKASSTEAADGPSGSIPSNVVVSAAPSQSRVERKVPTPLKLGLDRLVSQEIAVTKVLESELLSMVKNSDLLTSLDDHAVEKIKEFLASSKHNLLPPELKATLLKAGSTAELVKTTLSHLNQDTLRHLVLQHTQEQLAGFLKSKIASNPTLVKMFQHANIDINALGSKESTAAIVDKIKSVHKKMAWITAGGNGKKLDTAAVKQFAQAKAEDMAMNLINKHVFTNQKVVAILEKPMIKDISSKLGIDLGKWTSGQITKAEFKNDLFKAKSELLKIKSMSTKDIKALVKSKGTDLALGGLNKHLASNQKVQKFLSNSKVQKVSSIIGLDTSKIAKGQLTKADILSVKTKVLQIKGHLKNVKNVKAEIAAIKKDPKKLIKHAASGLKFVAKHNPKAAKFLKELEAFSNPENKFCWKRSYGRGAGSVPKVCLNGKQNQAGLCYRHCRGGFSGVGPVCWKQCPKKYKNHGLTCYKSPIKWHFKKSYGRGVGTVPKGCWAGKENQAGLCYRHCRGGFYGVGPVCWQSCTGSTPYNCGAACGSSPAACVKKVYDMVKGVLVMIKKITVMVGTAGGLSAIQSSVQASLKAGMNIAKEFAKKHLNKEAFVKFMMSKAKGKTGADGFSKMYDAARSKSMALDVLKDVDPTGVTNAVTAFLHSKC